MIFVGFNIAPANSLWIPEQSPSTREVSTKAERTVGARQPRGWVPALLLGQDGQGCALAASWFPCGSETGRRDPSPGGLQGGVAVALEMKTQRFPW